MIGLSYAGENVLKLTLTYDHLKLQKFRINM